MPRPGFDSTRLPDECIPANSRYRFAWIVVLRNLWYKSNDNKAKLKTSEDLERQGIELHDCARRECRRE
jgi:hypothetical protein